MKWFSLVLVLIPSLSFAFEGDKIALQIGLEQTSCLRESGGTSCSFPIGVKYKDIELILTEGSDGKLYGTHIEENNNGDFIWYGAIRLIKDTKYSFDFIAGFRSNSNRDERGESSVTIISPSLKSLNEVHLVSAVAGNEKAWSYMTFRVKP